MSWLTSFETLLNKVDQAAGQALHKEGGPDDPLSSPSGGTLSPSAFLRSSAQPPGGPGPLTSRHSPFLSDGKAGQQTKDHRRAGSDAALKSGGAGVKADVVAEPKADGGDKELFEFLNSPAPVGSVVVSRGDEGTSRPSGRIGGRGGAARGPGRERLTPNDMRGGDDASETAGARFEDDQSSGYHSNVEEGGAGGVDMIRVRQELDRENELLKREISSLNEELQTVLRRVHSTQEELGRAQSKLASQSRALSQAEQVSRELQARESDLVEALGVKDTQLGVMRSRLEEADQELSAGRTRVTQLQADRDRILADQSSSTGVQGQALDTLQEKLRDAEAALSKELELHRRAEVEWGERQQKLESDKQGLAAELSSLQRNITREKAQSADAVTQLKAARGQTEVAKQELSDYKDKAARILQSKDRLIASLKEGAGVEGGGAGGLGGGAGGVLASELESVRQERDVLRDEVQGAQLSLDNLRAELADVESQLQQEAESSRDQIGSLEEQIGAEQRRREDLELENSRQKQELRYVHEELLKQKTALQSRIQDRDAEIGRLRSQLTTKAVSGASEEELEHRLHVLTESLIQKQTMVEALSTDKSSLTLQLERMEKQYLASEAAALRASTAAVNIPDDDDVRQRGVGGGFMNESPYDGNVTRRVKLAANSIDRFSMRLGRFLRQYPIARVFVIVYMGILHLWVMIVLLTYQPEIHHSSYQPNEPHS